MSLSDDEQIAATPYDSGTKYETTIEGDIKLTTIYKEETGKEESRLSVFLEVTGAGYENERLGVDIVTVLDTGYSMKGEKLAAMKSVMRLLIDKLSSADRLSIVTTVSNYPRKLCGLRQMSIVSRAEMEKLVSGLETYCGKDVNGGLDMAFKVINNRKYATGRRVAVLLMSDGDFAEVLSNHLSFETLPVYTFGFGDDHNSMVLNNIAKQSNGGIYRPIDVRNSSPSNLTSAISECLTKLFTKVVKDLKLTFKREKSTVKIVNVCVGTYSCSYIPFTTYDDHVIVPYGDLFANETGKVKLDLLLPRVATEQLCDLLHVSYSYRMKQEVFYSSSRLVSVTRKMDTLDMYFGKKTLFSVGVNDTPNANISFQEAHHLSNALKPVESRNAKSISSVEQNTNIEEIQSSDQTEVDEIELVDTKMSEHLKQAFDSVKLIRDILRDYMEQYVDFQATEGALNDQVRSQNVKALGDHIRLTFDSVKAIEDILQNVEPLEGENTNDEPLEGEHAETQIEISDEEHEEGIDQVEYMSDHIKQAFGSVQIIREILNDYLKQHTKFEDDDGYSNDPVRTNNVKALGDHLQRAFYSVEAIENVLIKCA